RLDAQRENQRKREDEIRRLILSGEMPRPQWQPVGPIQEAHMFTAYLRNPDMPAPSGLEDEWTHTLEGANDWLGSLLVGETHPDRRAALLNTLRGFPKGAPLSIYEGPLFDFLTESLDDPRSRDAAAVFLSKSFVTSPSLRRRLWREVIKISGTSF